MVEARVAALEGSKAQGRTLDEGVLGRGPPQEGEDARLYVGFSGTLKRPTSAAYSPALASIVVGCRLTRASASSTREPSAAMASLSIIVRAGPIGLREVPQRESPADPVL